MTFRNYVGFMMAHALCASSLVAVTIDHQNSLVVTPGVADTIIVDGPLIIGFVNDGAGRGIKHKPVSLYIDRRKVATVPTNKYGVWSYMLNSGQTLDNGAHLAQAYISIAENNHIWTQASMFYVDAACTRKHVRSGNVNAANSAINFPFDGAYTNTSTPTVVGSLENATNSPVSGESVQVKINGVTVATVTSDSNGVFSYQLSNALSDGNYTVDAHCVQSNVNLTTNNFTVDTTPPAAPIITFPSEYYTDNSSTVIVTGTTEANATITVFMDDDTFGEICYADENGDWSIEYDGLANGDHTVSAQATDLAENNGLVSDIITFSVSA
jgi:large repetitive protein